MIIDPDGEEKDKIWNFQELRVYFNYVKSLEPVMTKNANAVIQRFNLLM